MGLLQMEEGGGQKEGSSRWCRERGGLDSPSCGEGKGARIELSGPGNTYRVDQADINTHSL